MQQKEVGSVGRRGWSRVLACLRGVWNGFGSASGRADRSERARPAASAAADRAAERPAMPTAREVESAVAAVYPALVNISAVSRDYCRGSGGALSQRRERRAGVRPGARADELSCRRKQHAHSLHAHRRADPRRRCRRARPADRPFGPPVAGGGADASGGAAASGDPREGEVPPGPAAGAARRRCRGRDRRPGPGPRQSLRALLLGDARHRLERPSGVHRLHRFRALGHGARRRRDDRLADPVDPARRADPARQLRRTAGESGGRGDRHQRARRAEASVSPFPPGSPPMSCATHSPTASCAAAFSASPPCRSPSSGGRAARSSLPSRRADRPKRRGSRRATSCWR